VAAGFGSVMVATVAGMLWWEHPNDAPMETPTEMPAPGVTVEPQAAVPARAEEISAAAAAAAPAIAAARITQAPPARQAAELRATAPPEPAIEQPAREVMARAARRSADGSAQAQNLTPAPAERDAAASIDPADLAGLLMEVRRQPERWTWQRDGAAPRPTDAALADWLAQAEAASRGRWQSAAPPPRDAGDARSRRELRLLAGGRLAAVLRLGQDSVSIEWPGGGASPQVAALDAAAAAELQSALDRLGEKGPFGR
jgi:hypothetical protein